MLGDLLLLALAGSAHAEDPPAASPPPEASTASPILDAQLAMAALMAANARALMDAAGALLAEGTTPDARAASARVLVQSGDPAALALLQAAVDAREPEVQIVALRALATLPGADAVRVATAAMRDDRYAAEVREEAIAVLGQLGTSAAADALWAATSDRGLPAEIRKRASEEIERSYASMLAQRGAPGQLASPFGVALAASGNGLAGAVMLSAVGTWGQSEGAAIIGGIGGGIIGLGTGVLYGVNRPLSAGQGLAYASTNGWGLAGSIIASNAVLGPRTGRLPYEWYGGFDQEEAATRRWRNGAAGLRLAGTAIGVGAGYAWMRSDPSPGDVLEVDLAGELGLEMGYAVADLATGHETSCVYAGDDYDLGLYDSVDCGDLVASVQARSFAGLGGLALGLGAGALASSAWEPDIGQLGFGAVAGAEAAWIGGWLPIAFEQDRPPGAIRLSLHAGVAGGLVLGHFLEPTPGQAALTGWGAVLGNTLGAGLADVSGGGQRDAAAVMVPLGLVGTAGGALLAPKMRMSGGDLAMMGVGVPLGVAESTAIAMVLQDEGVISPYRAPGLALTGSALFGLGFTALTVPVEPQVEDMLFLGSAAAWGVWYGVLTPIALGADWDDSQRTLTATLAGDGALLLGGLALPEALLDLDPRRTIVPQLAGVAGATLGALGVALASADPEPVAKGAVLGSAVGLIGGGIGVALSPPRSGHASLRLPRLDPPGTWSASLLPGVMPDGAGALFAHLDVTGW